MIDAHSKRKKREKYIQKMIFKKIYTEKGTGERYSIEKTGQNGFPPGINFAVSNITLQQNKLL